MQDIQKYRKWLDEAFDDIDAIFQPPEEVSEWTYCHAGRIVYAASKQARRLGAPELVHRVREFPDGIGFCQRDEALDALGRMLAWCREYERETRANFTLAQAANYLGMSESGLRKLVRRHAIEFSQARKGATIKFRKEWLDAYVSAQERTAKAPKKRRSKSVEVPENHGLDPNLVG